ncbi:MAG: MBL fold metallo-hydrolase [Paracoccaceae bacterium]
MACPTSITRRHALGGIGGGALALGAAPAFSAAEMLGPLRPTARRIALGGFEVTTIWDGGVALDGPHPIFGEDQEPAAVEALAAENNLPAKRMEISFTPVVINTGAELILFDTGNGEGARPGRGGLRPHLEAAGYRPEDIDVVVITHMHPDHIGGLMEGGAPAFPNARYVTGAAEYDFWSPEEKLSGPTERVAKLVRANMTPLAEKTTFIKPGDSVSSGIEAVEAYGHTPGMLAFHVESEAARLMLIADTANHYVISLQRPDWHVRFDMDKGMAAAARRRVLGMIAADAIPFTGYHMPFPAIGYLDENGDGFEYSAASYQFSAG